jgi:hypothetical protein
VSLFTIPSLLQHKWFPVSHEKALPFSLVTDHDEVDPNLVSRQACGLKDSHIHLFHFRHIWAHVKFLCNQNLYPVGDIVGFLRQVHHCEILWQ